MRILILIATGCAQAVYSVMKLAPVRRKVVLMSRQANRPSRDFRMLADEIAALAPDVEVVVRCRFIRRSPWSRLAYLGEVLAQMWHLATARVAIVDGYIIPVSVLSHRPDLAVVQMWHALGAIKRFGLQSVGRAGGRSDRVAQAMQMHRNYTFAICGGEGAIPAFSEAFGIAEECVLPLGLPRVDYLLDQADAPDQPEAIAALRERYPRLDDTEKTRILYAPTFRRDRATAFDAVVNAFDDERCTLIVKPHDLEPSATAGEHVVDATGVDALDLLGITDVVITDYSAIAFEAAVLLKPVFYYVYDHDEYVSGLGLNIDPLVEMPEVSSVQIEPIARAIHAGGYDLEAMRRFRDRYVALAQGGCTAALAGLVLSRVNGEGSGGE